MKVFGIILTVLGGFNFFALIMGLIQHPEDSDKIVKAFGPAIIMVVLVKSLV